MFEMVLQSRQGAEMLKQGALRGLMAKKQGKDRTGTIGRIKQPEKQEKFETLYTAHLHSL